MGACREGCGVRVTCAFLDKHCAGRPQDHHCIPKREIRSRYDTMHYRNETPPFTLTDALRDRRNLVKLCALTHHQLIENKRIYLTRAMLPKGIEDFANELGLEWYLDRYFDV